MVSENLDFSRIVLCFGNQTLKCLFPVSVNLADKTMRKFWFERYTDWSTNKRKLMSLSRHLFKKKSLLIKRASGFKFKSSIWFKHARDVRWVQNKFTNWGGGDLKQTPGGSGLQKLIKWRGGVGRQKWVTVFCHKLVFGQKKKSAAPREIFFSRLN